MDPRSPVRPVAARMNLQDLPGQGRVLPRPAGRPSTAPRIVPARGETQQTAHRAHRIDRLVVAHEPEPPLGIDPLSRANQAVAFARMSRSSLTRRSSRFSSRTSLCSAVVSPSLRSPSSRSAYFTQRRIAVADGSNSFANRSALRPARTSSTIRALNSGAYLRPLSAMVTPTS